MASNGAVVGLEGRGAIGLDAVGGQQCTVPRIGDLHLLRRSSALIVGKRMSAVDSAS